MNIVGKYNSAGERALAIKCLRLWEFYGNSYQNKNATILLDGVVFTLFTASRFVALNWNFLSGYLERIGGTAAEKLHAKANCTKGKPKARLPETEPAFH